MDRIEETAALIVDLNKFNKGALPVSAFISNVCSYFDSIKNEDLKENDFRFLKYIAIKSGIPHFYNILERFGQKPDIVTFDMMTFSSIFYESMLHTDEKSLLHRYQMQIIDKYETDNLNRYFLSASTSFGKTHLVFEIVKKMRYSNIVLIFPTIALLSENMERLISDENYRDFRENYSIHTLSDGGELGERNIFIYTPERFLSFIEKPTNQVNFDFAFIDEIYKIDNEYIIDDTARENERDVAYRLAVFYSLSKETDVLLAGPYMEFSSPENPKYNNSLDTFFSVNKISLLNYNDYEIVNKSFYEVKRRKTFPSDRQLNIVFQNNRKTDNLIETVYSIINISQNIIIYCANRGKNGGVEYYADILISSGILSEHDYSMYDELIKHISFNFTENWILLRALKHGIGIHHGLIPKYIQKEIIRLFNQDLIKVLISTTTITEGVNTSAKNMIVMHSKKGSKPLKKFDAKNIAGRAGRFGYHYSGRVIDLSNQFMKIIDGEEEILKHKNYDIDSIKDEIDLFYTDNSYLSTKDKTKKQNILKEQEKREIPDEILSQYKVVGRLDKIKIYDAVENLSAAELEQIRRLIRRINFILDIDYDGFQLVLDILYPIIKNQNLIFLIENKGRSGDYSTLVHLVHYFLEGGFKSSIRYLLANGKHIDEAIRDTARFTYNTLKYQTVKYLGVFNLMYKFYISKKSNRDFDDVAGIDLLLLKFEYNAVTQKGRIASDYGVPSSIVDYYENEDRQSKIKSRFDVYEQESFTRVEEVIRRKV